MILKFQENITEIPKKYRHMVKDFYKTPTGTWMIDLVDGYTTSYGTNYIENKYKKDCLYELMNEVSADKLEEALLYHGSPNKSLTKLEIGKEKTTGDEFGAGIYLTTDYNEAREYSGPDGRVYSVSLNTENLYNLKELLPQNIKEIVKSDLLDNKDIRNQIVRYNRKHYEVTDNKIGFKFYINKKQEWKSLDGTYLGNMPNVNKEGNKIIVTYTDYEDIDSAIEKLTGDDLQKILSHNMDPNVFVKLIIRAGYDGIITHNDNWYIIYKNEDTVKIVESKYKVEEASRNELLALAKMQTKTRYEKAAGYKGFSIVDIDTSMLLRDDTITVTCNVGKYYDTIQLMDVLIWIQMESERNPNNQVNTKAITAALMEAIDALEIKVDCTCPDFCLEENTKIKLLNGEVVKVKDLKTKFDNNEELWVYSTDENGDFKPGKVKDVWISGQVSKMIKVTLDNGKEIITTPNHKYMLRDGSYISAENLQEQQSLMPLYFRYTNGYENVKLNSKKTTQYHSVYKIVADTLLKDKIEEAKIRSGEEIIQIHHKDFDKLNNYPSNLEPKGKLEHWMYHAKLGGDNIQAFIKGGQQFWKEDPRRFEAREKQRKAARDYQLNMWKSFTPEEKQKYIQKCQCSQDSEKLSRSLKEVWNNYSEEEKEARLNKSNIFRNNNPMKNKEFLESEKIKERNKRISEKLKKFHSSMTSKEKSEMYGWAKGKAFTEDHKIKISKSLQGRTFTKEHLEHLRESGKRQAQQNKESRCLRNLNELIAANIEITPENFLNNRRPGDPHYNKVFNSFEDMLNHYGIAYNHKVISVQEIIYDKPINVYDIEVEDYHNFYVDAGVVLHNCYRFAYQATQLGYKYGKPENRPANITNPHNYGSSCKHLISMLSNKKWLQQVTGTIMDWVVKNIDKVNEFLRPKEGMELTLPNELARQNAKLGFYSKLFKDKLEDEPEEEVEDNVDNNNDTDNSNDNNDNVEDNKNNNQNNSNNINSDNGDDLDDSNINSDEEKEDNG